MIKLDEQIKVKYIGVNGEVDGDLILDKTYDVLSIEEGWYRIIDESGEDYLYPPHIFQIIQQ